MVTNTVMLVTIAIAVSSVHSARILAMFPIGAKSHQRFLQPVVMALAQAGHQVVLYSPYPQLLDAQSANLTHVYLDNISALDQSKEMGQMIQEITDYPFWKCLDLHWDFFDSLYPEVVNNKKIKELVTSNDRFDLIMTETFCTQEFTLILSNKFKVPVVGLQAFPSNNLINSALGNSLSISYIPDTCTMFSNKMTFGERLSNAFSSLRGLYYHYSYYIPKVDYKLRKDFPEAPPLEELTKSVSLMFVNDHLTADYSQPRPQNIIPVAGIHIQPPQALPQEIHKFMDEAKDGVIFFSLGTYVPDDLQPKEYFEMYNNVFNKLKQRVIWKTRKETIDELPSNVMKVKWAPQKDILAHPACVLFITHGGQLSRVEAINFGVPVITIPQFYDQHKNSEFYVQAGVGVKVGIKEVTEETMSAAIHQVLHDPSYRDNMKRLSAMFKDRPLSPAESVVFWTEYVLRHSGAAHLRPASTELRWYQLILLDVVVTILLAIFLPVYILILLVRKAMSVIRLRKSSTSQIKKS